MVVNVKRDWFEVFLKNTDTGETQKIARIKSSGLAYIAVQKFKEIYPGCECRCVSTGWKLIWDGKRNIPGDKGAM
jgi:hypothetical protein